MGARYIMVGADLAGGTALEFSTVTDGEFLKRSGTRVVSAAIVTFATIAVSGQSDIVADALADTLTVASGAGISLTTNAGTDTLTITCTITQYTDEMAQDAVGAMVDSSLVYVDATPLLTRAALTGDVTASQGSNATTIANDAVTFAKMQNLNSTVLIGRGAGAGSGDPQEITLSTNLSMSTTVLSALITDLSTTITSATVTFGKNNDQTIQIQTATSGAGKSFTIVAATGASGSDGGNVNIYGGTSGGGGGKDGSVNVGTSHTGTVNIGSSSTSVGITSDGTSINGPLTVDTSGSIILTGSGVVITLGGGGTVAQLRFMEASANGTDYVGFKAPASITPPVMWILPATDAAGPFISDGSGNMSIAAWADQTAMEAASSTTTAVVPGRVHYHPGVAKCWAYITVSGAVPTLQTSRNITSISDTATGRVTITIATDFSDANWSCLATVEPDTAAHRIVNISNTTQAAGSVELRCWNASNTLLDPAAWCFAGFGDQ